MGVKVVVLCTIFALFCGIGYMIWRKFKNRKVFFENLLSFCEHMLVEIAFSQNTVRRIIEIYAAGYSKPFRILLTAYLALLDKKTDITRERVGELVDENLIKPHEKNVLVDFFTELGRHGAREEKQKIENKKIAFDGFFKNCAEVLKRDASIYLKLFIFLGVGVVIILL
jgi:stage III sporulation protein AB